MKNLNAIIGIAVSTFLLAATTSNATEEQVQKLYEEAQTTLLNSKELIEDFGKGKVKLDAKLLETFTKEALGKTKELQDMRDLIQKSMLEYKSKIEQEAEKYSTVDEAAKELANIQAQNSSLAADYNAKKNKINSLREANRKAAENFAAKYERAFDAYKVRRDLNQSVREFERLEKQYKLDIEEQIKSNFKRAQDETKNIAQLESQIELLKGGAPLEEIEKNVQQKPQQIPVNFTQKDNGLGDDSAQGGNNSWQVKKDIALSPTEFDDYKKAVKANRYNTAKLEEIKKSFEGRTYGGDPVVGKIVSFGKTIDGFIKEQQLIEQQKK